MRKLLKNFFPKQFHNDVFEIDYAALWASGKRGLIFDVDNTLEPYNTEHPSERIVELINSLADMGFEICLLSNNGEARVELFNETLNVYTVHKAKKPGDKGLRMAFRQMGTFDDETVFIGDQIFTDIWCGNRFNVYTILVKPISKKEEWFVRLKRIPEKLVLRAYRRSLE